MYEALRDGLDEEFFVYHGLKYVDEASAAEGEADFLVLHREMGMLVIECKGYGVRRDRMGRWTRIMEGKESSLKENPFEQAQRHSKDLKKILEPGVKKAFRGLGRFPFTCGHAVAFPLSLVGDVNLPLDVTWSIVYDAKDLSSLKDRITETYRFWKKSAGKVPVLERHEFRKFRRRILHPALDLVPCLGAAVAADTHALVRLSREQTDVVDSWMENRRLKVKGGAGTGKTVLAMEAAARLARQGKSVLLVCFNRRLGDYLKIMADAWEKGDGKVIATTFHRLCARASHIIKGEGLKVPEEAEARSAFWDAEAPVMLLEAVEKAAIGPFDAVVVDEGQDFAASWWDVLEEMVCEDGRMLVFYDHAQQIFKKGDQVPDFPVISLTKNFRNTQRIAEHVCSLADVDMEPWHRCPVGERVVFEEQPSRSKMRKRLEGLVTRLTQTERLLPDQISILTPHSRKNSVLEGYEMLAGHPLADDPNDRAGALLHTTIGAFKGLESDVIILADVDPDDALCSNNALYVAASRARHLLWVFGKDAGAQGLAPVH